MRFNELFDFDRKSTLFKASDTRIQAVPSDGNTIGRAIQTGAFSASFDGKAGRMRSRVVMDNRRGEECLASMTLVMNSMSKAEVIGYQAVVDRS